MKLAFPIIIIIALAVFAAMKPAFPIIIIPLAVFAAWIFRLGWNTSGRSKKLCVYCAAFGVAALAGILAPAFKDPEQVSALVAAGLITSLLAAIAVILAIWALLVRRFDLSVGRTRICASGLFGVVILGLGIAIIVIGKGSHAPANGVQWTWRSEEHGFEVTIPTEQWLIQENKNVLASLSCSHPPIKALVAAARPAATDAEYGALLAYGKQIKADTPTTDTIERSELNRHGNPSWVYLGNATSPNGPYYFGFSITRVRGKAVIMAFEGHYHMKSEVGHAQEVRAFRTQAEAFLTSVK